MTQQTQSWLKFYVCCYNNVGFLMRRKLLKIKENIKVVFSLCF